MYSKSPNKEATAALDALLFSLAIAELYNKNDKNAHLLDTFTVCSKALKDLQKKKLYNLSGNYLYRTISTESCGQI